MSGFDQIIEIDEEIPLGNYDATMANDDVDISQMEAQMAELEAEQEKLKKIQAEVEERMNMSGSSFGSPVGSSRPTLQEKTEADARSVYVGNVDYSVTAKELEAHFHGCGPVTRVSIQCDKFSRRPKGFAYIEFTEKDGVQNALAMADSLLRGRQIKVNEKRTNKPGISTTNRFPRGRGGFNGRARGGVIVRYVYPHGFPPRGRGMRRGAFSKNNMA